LPRPLHAHHGPPGPPSARAARSRVGPRLAGAAALLLLALPLGCKSAERHRQEADEAVYALLRERREAIAADAALFSIEPPESSLRARLLAGEAAERTYDILACLEVAAENSRAYRQRREALYLAALDLTLEQYRFAVQTSGTLGAAVFGSGAEAEGVTVETGFGLSRLLGSGALIVGEIGLDLFRNLLSSGDWNPQTSAGLTIVQPLLAGFGREIVTEPLTQAQRNVIYEVRNYERFRRTFAVDVATRVYRILQQQDSLDNEEANYASLQALRERNEALAEAGRLSEIQADQARQDELRARSRVIDARQRLEALLDEFKLFLGLPVDAPFEVDSRDLVDLVESGLEELELLEARAIDIGLSLRLDHHTVLDRVDDAERRAAIAADALRTVLGVRLDVDAVSTEGKPLEFDKDGLDWRLGLDLSLPFERLPQRNEYRARLIALEAARRAVEQSVDEITADLRETLRELEARRESYLIQTNSEKLAERRVESTRLNFDAGRAETRDLLEAQNALLEARNALTRALVDYRLAVLALYRDLELLRVDRGGLDIERQALLEI
jgi:outer membrane protein TolC